MQIHQPRQDIPIAGVQHFVVLRRRVACARPHIDNAVILPDDNAVRKYMIPVIACYNRTSGNHSAQDEFLREAASSTRRPMSRDVWLIPAGLRSPRVKYTLEYEAAAAAARLFALSGRQAGRSSRILRKSAGTKRDPCAPLSQGAGARLVFGRGRYPGAALLPGDARSRAPAPLMPRSRGLGGHTPPTPGGRL